MSTLILDLRYTVRTLRQNMAFTVVAVLSLALGIGANTVVYSLIDAVLLNPVPVIADPENVVEDSGNVTTYPRFVELQQTNNVFADLAAHSGWEVSITDPSDSAEAQVVEAAAVSANYFPMLGVKPSIGRAFLPEEDMTAGTHPVAMISHRLWRTRFGASPSVLGQKIIVTGVELEIIGVTPPGFRGTRFDITPDVWVTLAMWPKVTSGFLSRFDLRGPNFSWLYLVGRLNPGTQPGQAGAALNTYFARKTAEAAERGSDPPARWSVASIKSSAISRNRNDVVRFMALLAAAVGLILLIACANVANLLLIMADARKKEIAVRLAIGANRWRLFRQLLTESITLSLAGGVLGILIALWSIGFIETFSLPASIDIANLGLTLHARTLMFTFLASVSTGILFGWIPSLQASKTDLISAMKRGIPGPTPGRVHMRHAFIAIQLTFSVVLLVGAGLFVRGVQSALELDLGFQPRRLATITVEYGLMRYTPPQIASLHRDIQARISALPGVESAVWAHILPLSGRSFVSTVRREGAPIEEQTRTLYNSVGNGYFRTMEIPMIRGREFTGEDIASDAKVAIVDEALAARLWRGEDPIGKRLVSGPDDAFEVIGVAGNANYRTIVEEHQPQYYLPASAARGSVFASSTLIVKTSTEPDTVLGAARSEFESFDRTLPISRISSFSAVVDGMVMPQQFGIALLGFLSLTAMALAAVGIYGVVAYSVRQRFKEIGIRMALGAQPASILCETVFGGMMPAVLGIAVGTALAAVTTRTISAFLYGISPTDTVTFAVTIVVLGVVSLAASYMPARRAAKVDPIAALRHE